ncbi:serine/threonine-protein kinase [Nannocystis sp.]|uniref:serine/threonine-protein kinase n=1 Tax=Nannocystis sp. TaxID=1962667 RepID=UPI0025D0C0D9|nr:serine/threonine-protein kinase [Nannocystis sp.]MBK7830024.1 AAA family ATPase [Nannocystis sp.]
MSVVLVERFELGDSLGRGASGVVHMATDRHLRRPVALKMFPARDPAELATLKAEFRIRKGLDHPNLVTLYELFVHDDGGFFTMEVIEGRRPFGAAFHAAVAAGDEVTARSLLTQLVHGVAATHDAGIVHRDLKPGNLLVDSRGRVVVLDFGLAMSTRQPDHATSGTLEYMAPEALWGQTTLASDWFSVGALLYEAIAGRLPWPRDDVHQRFTRVRADVELAPRVWPWLAAAVHDLLAVEAAARPTDAALRTSFPGAGARPPAPLAVPFVGRTAELAALRDALVRVHAGAGCLVTLSGPSGAGKSRLVECFLGELQGRGDVAVLRGSCHYTEHLPLAALDPLVDELARLLRSPALDATRSSAPAVGAAARLFPVLADDAAALSEAPTLLPTELRRQAIFDLRRLLRWLGSQVALVLTIDDAQWGDRESSEILRELLAEADGARALVLLVYRDGEERGALAEALRDWTLASRVDLALGPLADAEIASLLHHTGGVDEATALDMARRAHGSPFVGRELVQALRTFGPRLDASDPAALLHARLASLTPDERRLAQLTALAGRPLPRAVALAAAGLAEDGFLTALALERSSVLAGFPGDEHRLGVYHHQLRGALLAALAPAETSALHGDLADAIEQAPRADLELLLGHLLGAGRNARAIDVAVDAAQQARARLAFDRAAILLQKGLDAGAAGPRRVELYRLQGQSWRDAGIGARAAESFREAASLADPKDSSDLADVLWAEAAEEMVRHGRTEEGELVFRRLLRRRKISLPRRPAAAMLIGLARRVRLWWRGLHTPITDASSLAPAAQARQELMWKAANSLSLSRFPFSFCLLGQLVLEALEHGNRLQLVRTLGSEAAFSAALGGRLSRRADTLMRRLGELVRQGDPAEMHAGQHSFRALVAWNRGRWREVVADCDAFCALVRRELPGRAWDLAVMEVHACSALFHLGDTAALSARVPAALAAAQDRGDRFAVNHLRLGDAGSYLLLRDEPTQARRALAEAEADLSLGPSIETYYYTLLKLRTELHEAHYADAWAAIERLWPALTAGQIFAVEVARCLLHHLRGRTLVGLLAEHPTPKLRKRHEQALGRSLATLRKATIAAGPALAADLHASRVALTGDREQTQKARTAAAALLTRAELSLLPAPHESTAALG